MADLKTRLYRRHSMRYHSSQSLMVCCIVLLASCCQVAIGQNCEAYRPTGRSKCDAFLAGIDVYVPPNVDQDTIQDTLVYPQAILLGAYIPRPCRSTALQLLCVSSLPPCKIVNNSIATLFPCKDLCNTMVQYCNITFSAVGFRSLLPVCTPFPSTNCFNITSLTAPEYRQIDCPYPLKIDEDADQNSLSDPSSLCIYPCPWPIYTDEEYNGGWVMAYVISFISFFTGMFMIVTWSLSPAKRRFPANVMLWLAVASTGIAASVVWMVLLGGVERVVCTDDNPPRLVQMKYADAHDAGCIIQGVMLMYFALAANLWWLGVCIHLFEVIVLNWKYIKIFYRIYHVIAWGYPLVAVIIVLAAQEVAGHPSNSFCFGVDIQQGLDHFEGYGYGLYFSVSIFCLVVGTTLVFITMLKLLKWKLKLRKHSSISVWHLLRLLLLIFVYWWLLLWTDINIVYTTARWDDLKDAVEEQARCSAVTGTECSLSERYNYGLWWLNLFNIASVASAIFICVGTTKETFVFWWRLGKALFSSRDPAVWWANVTTELTELPDSDKRSTSNSAGSRTRKSGNSAFSSSRSEDEGDKVLHSDIAEEAL